MNREIKFRGKRVDNLEWIYGYYGVHQINHGVWSRNGNEFPEWHQVIPETVGQYTGLKDKNGNMIFEGDIVLCSYFKMAIGHNLGAIEVDAELKGVIQFNDLSLCVTNIVGEKWSHYTGYTDGEGSCEITYLHDVYEGSTEAEMSIEIIGNIYDNPELLNH